MSKSACTSPLYRIPFVSPNFPILTARDQMRLKNHGVFLPYEAVLAYNDIPGWNPDLVQKIRCGQCTACRLSYSFDWAVRCVLEASLHEHNYFITLTYDDLNLPSGEFVDFNGTVWDSTLRRRDIQLFIKSLREWERTENDNTVKVFYCGEYGSEEFTHRPHYHLIVFGASPIPDLTWYKKKGSFDYYKSIIYESFWHSKISGVGKILKGFVDISEASFDNMAYTARYCMKKQRGLMKSDFLDFYDQLDPGLRPDLLVQPFVGMSLKPGIASEYWEANKHQIMAEDAVKYQKNYQLFCSKPPRYFDKLFDNEDPVTFSKIKAVRQKVGIEAEKAKTNLYSEDYLSRLAREEQMLIDKENKRVRSL